MPSLYDNPDFIAACRPHPIKLAKPKRKARPEAAIQKQIISYLLSQGYMAVRINSAVLPGAQSGARVPSYVAATPRGKHTAGHPDVVAYRDGRAVFFEIKTPTGKLSDRQKRFIEVLDQYNMPTYVVRSVNDVKTALGELTP